MALGFGNNRTKRVANLFKSFSTTNFESNIFSQEQNFYYEKELPLIIGNLAIDPNKYFPELKDLKRKLSPTETQALFDFTVYLKDDLLVKVDRATMHHSLETRVPLLDYRIVEFAVNLDEKLKLKGNTSKYLLKEVLYDFVPREYFDRPKKGFSVPMHQWLRSDLKVYAEKYVTQEMCERYGLVKWSYAKQMMDHFYKDKLDFYYNRVWLIICLHKYMELNF
jgi:asparagine synthase (glutamine-hydrolysing)